MPRIVIRYLIKSNNKMNLFKLKNSILLKCRSPNVTIMLHKFIREYTSSFCPKIKKDKLDSVLSYKCFNIKNYETRRY